jgi:methanogenic corrinoid protein MtbC1
MATGLTSAEAKCLAEPQTKESQTKTGALWVELLNKAIENEVLPRLLDTSRRQAPGYDIDVGSFLSLIVADNIDEARAMADRMILQTGSREALLNDLLTPAAKLLGTMWEQDICDFMTVTLGVYRLDQIMKETATSGWADHPVPGFEHRILLLPAPGEQHSFGLGMVADAFREGGWCVRSGPAATKAQLLRLVHDEWFDVIGLSVSSERWLKGLPGIIRAVRSASCNAKVFFMVGGQAISNHMERTRFLGADASASDAYSALQQANNFMETAVTPGLHKAKTQLVDAG